MIDCRKSVIADNSNKESKANKANEILAWRDYLTTMDDEKFFNLIHIYLGEVKTPYNKQKLIEELSSFLRKDDHKKIIVSLLSKNDIKILILTNYIEL